jgi:putative transposase
VDAPATDAAAIPSGRIGNVKTLGRLIGAFKTVSTKRINELRTPPGLRIWQRNYHERIIRDQDEMNRIREYVKTNPRRWNVDRGNSRLHRPQ